MFQKKISLMAFGFVLLLTVSINAQSDIRKIDFNNFTYEMYDLSGENKIKVAVKNGEFIRDDPEDRFYFNVMGVTYGDLDGD